RSQHGKLARSGIEPDVENIVLFAEGRAAALRAARLGTGQFLGALLEPDVGCFFGEQLHHAIENPAVDQRLLALLAIKRENRHAPDALARDAPVRARGNHIRDTLAAPIRIPFHSPDRLQRALAQIVALHADEPLFGGAENRRVVTPPAMRIAVLDVLLSG